jgi:hypothetical protein
MAKCIALKPNGQRCKIDAMADSDMCWSHDPSFKEKRRRRAAKGGKAGGRGRPTSGEIAEIKDRLRKIAKDVRDPKSKVMRGDAAVAIQAYAQIMNCIRTDLKRREQEELVERLEALEGVLAERKRGAGYYA